MSESKSGPRVIKKYPNRRLYDTVESRYITLDDIRRLVVDQAEFRVIDKKTDEDITRSILLQVISEQEHCEPMMSQDFLSQVIRSYGGAMQDFVGNYLETSLKMFTHQQAQMRERLNEHNMPDPFTTFASLAHKNLEFWRGLQDQFLSSVTGGSPLSRGKPAGQETAEEPPSNQEPPTR